MSLDRKKLRVTAKGLRRLNSIRGNPKRSKGATLQMLSFGRISSSVRGQREENVVTDISSEFRLGRTPAKALVKRWKSQGLLRTVEV